MEICEFIKNHLLIKNRKGHTLKLMFNDDKNELDIYCYDTEKLTTIKTSR